MDTRDVKLSWDDPNLIEKGYKVYRSNEPMDINNMPVAIADLPPKSENYTDQDQLIGNTNYYRVSSWIGGSELFSNEVMLKVETAGVMVLTSGSLIMLDRETGAIQLETSLPATPRSVNTTPTGNYVVGFSNGTVRSYDPNGNEISYAFRRSSTVMSVASLPNGDIVAGYAAGMVDRFDQNGNYLATVTPSGDEVFGLAAHRTEDIFYVTARNNGSGVQAYNSNNSVMFTRTYASSSQNGQAVDTSFTSVVHSSSGTGIHSHDGITGVRAWGYNPAHIRDAHSLKIRLSDGVILTNASQSGGASPLLIAMDSDRNEILRTGEKVVSGYHCVAIDEDGMFYNVIPGGVVKRDDTGDIKWEITITDANIIAAPQPILKFI